MRAWAKPESAREILSDLKACRREPKDLLFDAIANLSKTKPPRNSQPKSLSAVSLLHHSQIVNEANYAFGDFLGFNFAYNNFLFQYIRQPSIAEYQCGGLKELLGIWKTLSHGTASLGR